MKGKGEIRGERVRTVYVMQEPLATLRNQAVDVVPHYLLPSLLLI